MNHANKCTKYKHIASIVSSHSSQIMSDRKSLIAWMLKIEPVPVMQHVSLNGRSDFIAFLISACKNSSLKRHGWDLVSDEDKGPVVTSVIPHSVATLLETLTSVKMSESLPVFVPVGDISVITEALAETVKQVHDYPAKDGIGQIPHATVIHNRTQLRWNRVSTKTGTKAPLCYFSGDNCVSLMPCASITHMHSHGPLHGELTMDEEERFQRDGVFPEDRPCILCSRRIIGALISAHGDVIDPKRQYGNAHVYPLNAVMVNIPGGYTYDSCYPISNVLPVPVPRADIPLVVREDDVGYFYDEGVAIFGVQRDSLN